MSNASVHVYGNNFAVNHPSLHMAPLSTSIPCTNNHVTIFACFFLSSFQIQLGSALLYNVVFCVCVSVS